MSVFLNLGAGADDEEAEGVEALEDDLERLLLGLEGWEVEAAALPPYGFELEAFALEFPLEGAVARSSSLRSQ